MGGGLLIMQGSQREVWEVTSEQTLEGIEW